MNRQDTTPVDTLRRASDQPRDRKCLRCGTTFPSEWSGERICRRCKSTTGWRDGRSHSGTPNRRR